MSTGGSPRFDGRVMSVSLGKAFQQACQMGIAASGWLPVHVEHWRATSSQVGGKGF